MKTLVGMKKLISNAANILTVLSPGYNTRAKRQLYQACAGT